MFKEFDLPDYAIEQFLSDPKRFKNYIMRGTKSPHNEKKRNPHDPKNKYGLLYTTFNNFKNRMAKVDYSVRQDFIGWYIDDPEYKLLFKEWKRSGWAREWKPSFYIKDKDKKNPITKNNIKFGLYEDIIKLSHAGRGKGVIYLKDGVNETKRYDSIRQASDDLGVAITTIRSHMKKKRKSGEWTFIQFKEIKNER